MHFPADAIILAHLFPELCFVQSFSLLSENTSFYLLNMVDKISHAGLILRLSLLRVYL